MATNGGHTYDEFFDFIASKNNLIRELINYINIGLTFFSLPIMLGYLLYQTMLLFRENVLIIILFFLISVHYLSLGVMIKNFNKVWKSLCIFIRHIAPYWNMFIILALIEPIYGLILSTFINMGAPILFCGGPIGCFNMVIEIFGNFETFAYYYFLGLVVLALSDCKI